MENKLSEELENSNNNEIVEDIDGNQYNTVKIGEDIWMTSNLRTTRYYDGKTIKLGASRFSWLSILGWFDIWAPPRFCWSIHNPNNKIKYHALYNWSAVRTGKLAPIGWHVATEVEWNSLIKCLGSRSYRYIYDEFAAIPVGFRCGGNIEFENAGKYTLQGVCSLWWSRDSHSNKSNPKYFGLIFDRSYLEYRSMLRYSRDETLPFFVDDVETGSFYETSGLSVRCVKDRNI